MSYGPTPLPVRPERHPPGYVVAGKFRVERRIGSGGSGTVYEAKHLFTGRAVALKWLSPASLDAQADDRFFQEAKSASRLSHPSIVGVLDLLLDPTDQSFWMVQELLVGQSLRQLLDQVERVSHEDLPPIAVPLMSALALAHRHGIVHRDLKPDNVFLAETAVGMVPKLIDFGIAKRTDASVELVRTQTGLIMGTPRYMSPEQTYGGRLVDGRSDVWSLGVVIYEMLAGQSPFASMASLEEEGVSLYDLMQELFAEIREGRKLPLRTVAKDVPEDVAAAVERALAPNPKDRYGRMEAFLEALFGCAAYAPQRTRYAEWFDAIERAPAPAEAGNAGTTASVQGDATASAARNREAPAAEDAARAAAGTELATTQSSPIRERRPGAATPTRLIALALALAVAVVMAALLWPGAQPPPGAPTRAKPGGESAATAAAPATAPAPATARPAEDAAVPAAAARAPTAAPVKASVEPATSSPDAGTPPAAAPAPSAPASATPPSTAPAASVSAPPARRGRRRLRPGAAARRASAGRRATPAPAAAPEASPRVRSGNSAPILSDPGSLD